MAPQFFWWTIHQVIWPSPGTLCGAPGRGYRDPLLETAQDAVTMASPRVHRWAQYLWQKKYFWAFVFGSGMSTSGPWVNCPYAPNSDCLLYNYFSIFVQFFAPNGPSFFGHHDSPSNLAESRYPRRDCLKQAELNRCEPSCDRIEFWSVCIWLLGPFEPRVNCPCASTPPLHSPAEK